MTRNLLAVVIVALLILPGCGSSSSANRPAAEVVAMEEATKKAEKAPDTVPKRNPVQTKNDWQFLGEEFARAFRPVCIATAIATLGLTALITGGCS